MDQGDDVIAAVDQVLHPRLGVVPPGDPLAEVAPDGPLAAVRPGVGKVRTGLPDEVLGQALGREAALPEGAIDLPHGGEVLLGHALPNVATVRAGA